MRAKYEDIIEYGDVQRALLGVSGNGLNDRISKEYNIDVTEGFYIASVEDEVWSAKDAGLQTEDIIIGVDDTKVSSFADMTGYLNSKRPGDKMKSPIFEMEYYENHCYTKAKSIFRLLGCV